MRNLMIGAAAVLLTPAICAAQSPPPAQTPVAPKVEQLDSTACANPGSRSTIGQGGDIVVTTPPGRTLSDQLARSGGVICPPGHVDSDIHAPTPPGGAMQVIPPPGSPGGDQSIQPK
ncbi:MAG: hypothetical protein Q8M24_24200 [Pseudolabrys sp.]|nr:hypothetical protein [Pseudolabrys sp.]MDP2298551.1 hypothetical protein [Pseudolabrys sp.]